MRRKEKDKGKSKKEIKKLMKPMLLMSIIGSAFSP